MRIDYIDSRDFNQEKLQELFLSVKWASGRYPERLVIAMRNSSTVFSAWDGDKLVGLASVLDDKAMTAYVHYLLVKPEYQGKGIGKELLRMIKEKYENFPRIVLISYNKQIEFYQGNGFMASDDSTPMSLSAFLGGQING